MEIRSVGVLGAGQMGLGIAQAAARAGFETTLAKATPGALDSQRGKVEKQLQKDVEKGKLTAADHGALLERLRWSTKLDDLAKVDIVIESIVEELPTKRDHFAKLDRLLKPDAILATNTSTLTVADLSGATKRPERFIGLHFFSPVPVMGLIEIIRGLETADATASACREFAGQLGKTVIESRDYPGFIVNRMLAPFINEAVFALMDGTGTAEAIDNGARLGLNHPIGPLELSDFVGNDVMLNILDVLYRGFGDPKFRAAPLLRQMVSAGHLGRKSGRGFYRYDEQGHKVG